MTILNLIGIDKDRSILLIRQFWIDKDNSISFLTLDKKEVLFNFDIPFLKINYISNII